MDKIVCQVLRNRPNFCLPAVEKLEYSLAEFTKPDNLARAFHKVQDVVLSEKYR